MAKADKENNPPYISIENKIEGALLDSRRIFLSDAVDNETADDIIRKLWYLEMKEPGKADPFCDQ